MKPLMRIWMYWVPLVFATLSFAACMWVALRLQPPWDIALFYGTSMRGSLFAGFLTLGSFLLSLKVGIVIKIKEAMYDNPLYKQHLAQKRSAINPALSAYGPLRRLSHFLSWSVFSALICATLQMTVGLMAHWLATAICLSAATFTICLLLTSFILIQMNLADWFDFIETSDIALPKAQPDPDDDSG